MNVKKNNNIVLRKIYDVVFLIDITEYYSEDKGYLYEINELGEFIWDKIDNSRSRYDLAMEIKKALIDEVPFDEVLRDVNGFIDQLISRGLVIQWNMGTT